MMKARVMELNASDERGISVVRDKIKAFAATAVGFPVAGYPCPPYKLLILDEADAMTQVLRCSLLYTSATLSQCWLKRHTHMNIIYTWTEKAETACCVALCILPLPGDCRANRG